MAPLLLVAAVLAIGTMGVLLVFGLLTTSPRLVTFSIAAGALLVGGYALALLAGSALSHPRVLEFGQEKEFCGFYLDCHLSVAVLGDEVSDHIGTGATRRQAHGVFHVVTVRVANSAKRVDLALLQPVARIVDTDGRSFAPIADGGTDALMTRLGPGGSANATLVFDVPRDARNPRLLVSEGFGIDHVIELLLIGDEDSAGHAKTYHRLGTS
jgi:hypothetical protein